MSKLGTKNKPCILRVKTQERMDEIIQICDEQGIIFICGIEPDKAEDISDLEKALNLSKVATLRKDKIGRNDPCFCGSGKKFKKCCITKTSV